MSKRKENRQPSVALDKLASRLNAWLQCYRLVVSDELVAEYAKVLKVLSEEDLNTALDLAAKENESNYAPSPGVVLTIAEEIIRGREHPALSEMATWKSPTKQEREDMIQSAEWQALKASLRR